MYTFDNNCNMSKKSATCSVCGLMFNNKTNIYKHMTRKHNLMLRTAPAFGLICPLCQGHSFRQVNLREHLQRDHDVKVEASEIEFNTVQDFESWKRQIETESFTCYVQNTAPKKLSHNIIRSYFVCHRGGYSNEKCRKARSTSYKMQGTCPSLMSVSNNGSIIKVVHYKTHVGHLNEPECLPIQKLVKPLDNSMPVIKVSQQYCSNPSTDPTLYLKIIDP